MRPTACVPPRRRAARLAPVLLALALAAGACSRGPELPRGALLISVDSLRPDHLSCYGYQSLTNPDQPTSPNVDRLLARDGTLFERAISTTNWTLPAHMAMLTGLPNELHGVVAFGDRLHPSRPTLAEAFRDGGWSTAGFFSGPNLHPFFGFGRGFQRYVDCSSNPVADPEQVFAVDNSSIERMKESREAVTAMHDASHLGHTGPKVAEAFEEWFADVADDERFFAFVHLWDVHYDYEPPARFDVFDPGYNGALTGADPTKIDLTDDPPSRRDVWHLAALYDGEILFTDDTVARILGTLASRRRLEDCVVVFTSDHGEEFADHLQFGHMNDLYEEMVHVPLIVRYPPLVRAGARVSEHIGIVDIAPTLLDLCGLPRPELMWGRSLRPLLTGEGTDGFEGRLLPTEYTAYIRDKDAASPTGLKRNQQRGAHEGLRKTWRTLPTARVAQFDLERDPRELKPELEGELNGDDDLIRRSRRLWRQLDERAAKLPRSEGSLPDDLREALESTGYIDDEHPAPPADDPQPTDDPQRPR